MNLVTRIMSLKMERERFEQAKRQFEALERSRGIQQEQFERGFNQRLIEFDLEKKREERIGESAEANLLEITQRRLELEETEKAVIKLQKELGELEDQSPANHGS